MLELTAAQRAELEAAALNTYPHECCGLLLGELSPDGHRRVAQVWPTRNAWTAELEAEFVAGQNQNTSVASADSAEHSQRDRFWIDPRELLRVQKCSRAEGRVIVGIYHSHPDHPAVPSERDRRSAWPEYSYVILSVVGEGERSPRIADCRSWRLDNSCRFHPEALTQSA